MSELVWNGPGYLMGVSYAVLPFWYDVDDLKTLRQLAGHLGLMGPYGCLEAPRTEKLLSELDAVASAADEDC